MVALDVGKDIPLQQRMKLLQVIKSHSAAITKISINPNETILVSGSEDKTIFVHQLIQNQPYLEIQAMGLVQMPSFVTAISWNPKMVKQKILKKCSTYFIFVLL